MVFPVVMYGCKSWTIRKAEHQRTDAFELWFGEHSWESLGLQRYNQSILKETSSQCSLEGLMLKLKLHYFGHLMWRADSFQKTLMLGKIEGRRRRVERGWNVWIASLTQWTWVWVGSGSWCWTGSLLCCGSWGHKESDMTEWLNWITDSMYFNV